MDKLEITSEEGGSPTLPGDNALFADSQLLFNQHLESAEWLGAQDRLPVDQKRGRAGYPDRARLGGGGFNQLSVFARVKAFIERFTVQPQVSGELLQLILREIPFVFPALLIEEQVVVLPEGILVSGAFGSFRSPVRFIP